MSQNPEKKQSVPLNLAPCSDLALEKPKAGIWFRLFLQEADAVFVAIKNE